MFSRRMLTGFFLLIWLGFAPRARAQDPVGGHTVRVGLWLGHMSFSERLHFDSDQVFGLRAAAGFTDWAEVSVALGQMTMRDQRRDVWNNSVQFDMHGRFMPLAIHTSRAGMLLGVSFTGFEEDALSDAVAEGLDVGFAANWNATELWTISADLLWRMQTFNLLPRDSQGTVIGGRAKTGYVWSRLLRLGVGHAF
ncbi:MAG TPA: hypothetical protein VGB13_00505 [Candidatus Krumholzibacteria bacterium]